VKFAAGLYPVLEVPGTAELDLELENSEFAKRKLQCFEA
jgi:hypothetical protein